MKKNIQLLALVLILLLQYNYSLAAKYYFSATGDDSRSAAQAQNPSTPWKSIDKLNAVFSSLKPGDEVLFNRGDTFYGSIHINAAGAQGRPITIGAYGSGNKPIITSLVTLNNWTNIGNGIYESHHPSLGSEVNVVLLDDAMQEMGRYPNGNSSNNGYLTIQSTNGHNNVVGSGLSGNWNGGEVVIRKSHWTIDRHKIVSQFGNILSFDGKGGSYSPSKGYGFFIQGHPNTLDQEGEWYFNPSSKRLRMHFGSSQANSKRVEVSTKDFLVTNSWNKGFIVFDNVHLKGANKKAFHIVRSNNFHIKNCDIEFSGENGMTIEDSQYFTFENSRLLNSNNNGLDLRGNTANAVIKSNKIQNTGIYPGMGQNGVGNGIAILAGSDNNLIEYNEVKNTGYVGIRFGGNSTVLKNNLIESFCVIKDDGAAIYTWSGPSNIEYRGRKIIGNIILNGIGASEGTPSNTYQVEGIYLDDNSSGVEITDNTVSNVPGKGIFLHNARNVVIQNNTSFNNGIQLRLAHDRLGNPIRNATIRDNIFVAKTKDQLTASTSSVKNDIREMGNFDNNSYARPFNDFLTFFAHNGSEKSEVLDLESWKSKFGKDHSSQNSPIKIPEYEVTHIDKNNKYANGAFDTRLSTIQGIYGSHSKISWVNNQLDGGTLQVEGRGNSSITKAVGSVKRSTYYVLKFTAKATKDAYVDLTIMKSIIPFTEVAPKVTLKISKGRGEYEAVFPVDASQPLASIRFAFNNQDLTYWLDNVGLYEANATPLNPDDYFKFEYNYSGKSKEIALDGSYVDMKNNAYSGKVSLAPYSSKVLIRTSKSSGPVEQPNQAPDIAIVSPSSNAGFDQGSDIEFQADAVDKDGKIAKVEFFNGTKLLGTANSAPYVFIWEGVPLGEYTITAKATDDKSSSTVSEPVKIKVKAPASVDEGNSGKPGGEDNAPRPPKEEEVTPGAPDGKFALYLNAGSHEDVRFEGKMFKGDDGLTDYYSRPSSKNSNTAASDEALYQTERHAEALSYSIPVPNGTYTVKTYHNELWFGKGGPSSIKGRRIFNISLEGQLVKDDFDIYEESSNKQVVLTFDKVEVKDGRLSLELVSSENRATISGISVESIGDIADDEVPTAPVEPPSTTPAFSLYLNAGSDKDYEYQGQIFQGDVKYAHYYNSSTSVNINLAASSDDIFTTERHAEVLEYSIPVPNGTYTVKTYHNELWFGKGGPSSIKGRRVFNISLEGKLVKNAFDMYEADKNKQVVLTFDEVEVKDGKLNLEMVSSRNRATISALSIISSGESTDIISDPNASIRPNPEVTGFSLYLNAGSNSDLQIAGNQFQGDDRFTEYFGNSTQVNTNLAAGNDALYQTERHAETLSYSIPVPNGTYTVETHHNELWFGKGGPSSEKGRRIFNISIEGVVVQDDLDLYVESRNNPIALTFHSIEVTDGVLNLDMASSRNRATISGIAIYEGSKSMGSANFRTLGTGTTEEPIGPEMDLTSHGIKLYPNPATESTTLSVSGETNLQSILIHNTNGQLMRNLDPSMLNDGQGNYVISLSNMPQGVYLVSLVGRENIIERIRLIVKP